MSRRRITLLASLVLSALVYGLFGYGYSDRGDFLSYILMYGILFAAYLTAIRLTKEQETLTVAAAGLCFRLILIFSLPVLSDDYYRFIWDGALLNEGINPYTVLPQDMSGDLTPYRRNLLEHMNSHAWFTTYPPVCQLIFYLSCKMFPGSLFWAVVAMRAAILAAEAGSTLLLLRLCRLFSMPAKNTLYYLINPLIITELTGNLHFEGVMIFFLLLSVFFLFRARPALSAAALAGAVSVKVLPLLFLPVLWRHLGFRAGSRYALIVLLLSAATLLPFLDPGMLRGAASGFSLYFRHFEFNGSVYQLLKWIGLRATGYNTIAVNGIILSVSAFFLVNRIAWKHPKGAGPVRLFRSLLFAATTYYLLALVVHPWYIATLVVLSVFTGWRYPVVWTALIPFTYLTYSVSPYKENLWVIVTEYTLLVAFLLWESIKSKRERLALAP